MNVLLKGIGWHNGSELLFGDVHIEKGIIDALDSELPLKKGEPTVDCHDCYLYPGLINAHDHLEMNLYSHLGTPPWSNYVEWAQSIYLPDQSPIREIEQVSIKDRLLWGGLKNLISGVTSVAHHNPWHRMLGAKDFPVKVMKVNWAHSLKLGNGVQKSSIGRDNTPFVVHAAEGIDALAHEEISILFSQGLLKNNTVLIHAIALSESDLELLSKQHPSVVWCPASNLYMFNKTAPIHELKNRVLVALGSDSTLTGSATLLDELKTAHATGLATSRELFNMVTRAPAQIFNLPVPTLDTQLADFFIARKRQDDYFDNLIGIAPEDVELVVTQSGLKLLDREKSGSWAPLKNIMKVGGREKFVSPDVSALKGRIARIAACVHSNPLWQLIDA